MIPLNKVKDLISRHVSLEAELSSGKIDKKKLEEAVLAVELNDFVNSLSSGLETIVGERGSRLSGGQRQRIGLARALYNNPEFLVLDETTNSLEEVVQREALIPAIMPCAAASSYPVVPLICPAKKSFLIFFV